MAVQNETRSAGPAASKGPGPVHRALTALYEIRISTVFYLVSASLGLGLVAPQVQTEAVVVIFAVFWGVTVIAMLALSARMLSGRVGHGRHRRVAHG